MARIQAYGSDGEKALTDDFKRNFEFAFGLPCFIHFKKNIEKELSERIFDGLSKRDFILEMNLLVRGGEGCNLNLYSIQSFGKF